MADELNNVPQQEQDVKSVDPIEVETVEKEEAGCLGIGASVLFPIIGVIIYFAQRKEVKNPSAYLWGALAGMVIGLVIRLATA